jgi:subtilisin family serine protease
MAAQLLKLGVFTQTTVTTTVRNTVYTDGTTVTEPVSVTSNDAVTETVSTSTREELQSRTVTPNVAGTSDTTSDETTSVTGTATVTTTYVDDVRTGLDDNGSTVTETWRVYTDTTTTPITTTVTTTTTRTTTYTDGTTSAEVIDVSSTSSTSNTVTTGTREELLSTVTTPNVASVTDSTSSSTTTTVSDPVFDRTVTNTDTRPDGVWTYYYDYWVTTTTAVTTITTTRTTTYTDGTSTAEVIDVATTENVTTAETYTTRIVAPEATPADPSAPESNAGTTVTQDNAPVLDYDPATYNYQTYYNSDYVGTPTAVDSNDPADFVVAEADNNAVLDVNANYAYARGWTGKGSTVLIMDSGIDTDHPEFEGKIKYTWDAGYDLPVEDENGHGTHVAGIVAAAKNGTGMHGIAYDAELAVAKITDTGYGNYYAISALNWAKQYEDIVAANLSSNTIYSSSYRNSITNRGNGIFTSSDATYGGSNYYNLENPATWAAAMPSELVLTVSAGNLSLGYVQNPATFATAVDADGNLLFDGRMLVVGNWNTSTSTIDGAQSGHVCKDYTVTCNDPYLTKDFYILAPGSQVNSTYLNGEYKSMSGTSMAAPVVAGAVAIVHQLWPYMKGSNIAQLLLQTADKTISGYDENTHGQGLLDLDQATRPVGELGISLTGRTGASVALSGSISVNGVDNSALSSIAAVDDYDRDFTVDLSGANVERKISVEYAERQKNNGGWASTMANLSVRKIDNVRFAASDNVDEYSVGYEHHFFDTNLTAGVSYTKADTNPWIDMSGMWGEVNGSQTTELNLTYDYKDMWAQVGVMNTNTRYKTGLVTDVDDIQSVYATVGYDADSIAVFGGIKPYAVNGSVTMRLPTSVDADGVMHYDTVSSRVRSELDGYVGFKHNYQKKNHSTTFVGIVDGGGEGHLNFNYRYKF